MHTCAMCNMCSYRVRVRRSYSRPRATVVPRLVQPTGRELKCGRLTFDTRMGQARTCRIMPFGHGPIGCVGGRVAPKHYCSPRGVRIAKYTPPAAEERKSSVASKSNENLVALVAREGKIVAHCLRLIDRGLLRCNASLEALQPKQPGRITLLKTKIKPRRKLTLNGTRWRIVRWRIRRQNSDGTIEWNAQMLPLRGAAKQTSSRFQFHETEPEVRKVILAAVSLIEWRGRVMRTATNFVTAMESHNRSGIPQAAKNIDRAMRQWTKGTASSLRNAKVPRDPPGSRRVLPFMPTRRASARAVSGGQALEGAAYRLCITTVSRVINPLRHSQFQFCLVARSVAFLRPLT